ncbi:MAG: type II toxin-antitoxin system HicB family antitoxin [Pleurocapsa sp. SU_196_0]|nr:type II toxin-antitoxin system HicB family antitoxin [Pleurocapsa sp. SU_196_0]
MEQRLKFVYWQDTDFWVGYLEEYPDYWTQGESLEELKSNLLDLYTEFRENTIPGIRRVGELMVA